MGIKVWPPIYELLIKPRLLVLNYSFEDWSGTPEHADHWTPRTFGTAGTGSWVKDTTHVKHGSYSARIGAGDYAHGRLYRQFISAGPARGRPLQVRVWAWGYANPNCGLQVAVDGTGSWTKSASVTQTGVWQDLSVTGDVPLDATYIRIDVRTYSPQAGPVYVYFDWVRATLS